MNHEGCAIPTLVARDIIHKNDQGFHLTFRPEESLTEA